jgi:hypothetical protein
MMERLRIPAWVPALVLTGALVGGWGSPGFAWGQTAPSGKVASPGAAQHLVCGIVYKINGAKFSLETRNGRIVQVDASAAIHAERSAILYEGVAVSAEGTLDKKGVLQAENINRIKSARVMWPEDR